VSLVTKISSKDAKLLRLKEFILEEPRTYQAIKEHMKLPHERTLKRYLAHLEYMKDIENPEKGLYKAPGASKIIFNTKTDYDLALEHSKKLFAELERNRSWQTKWRVGYKVKFLAFDSSQEYLRSHLKQGYFKEIGVHLERYRKLMVEFEEPNYHLFLCSQEWTENYGVSIEHQKEITRDMLGLLDLEEALAEEKSKNVPQGILKELESLDSKILGQYNSIMTQVRLGIPLKGTCTLCPKKNIILRDLKRGES